jgi:D-glycero-alpha-D-manno-heptose-7-phosphate kinase
MICSRTPFRMSFIGGGTDIKEFYKQSTGCVISTSINKYMYIFIHPFFDNRIQVKYAKTELVDHIDKIKHPIVRAALKKFNLCGVDINSIADIPSGTGLGSSSSYTVGLLQALYGYIGHNISKDKLAQEACEIEIEILKEPIGKQDQYEAAYGGLNLIRFYPNGEVNVEPIKMNNDTTKQLEDNLLLFYIGNIRSASEILYDQKHNLQKSIAKYNSLLAMAELAGDAKKCLSKSDLDGFGIILDKNWKLKRSLSNKISNHFIDDIYNLAKKNGALGGKVLGAGGGGFVLLYCVKQYQERLRDALYKLKEVSFKFEKEGSILLGNI